MTHADGQPRVIVTRRWPPRAEAEIRRRWPNAQLNRDDTALTMTELRSALAESDVVFSTITDRLSAELFDGPVRTRLIAQFGTGYDNIDTCAAARAGTAVTNTPDVLTHATAELALLLMLMVARRAGEGERELRAGAWSGWHPTHLLGTDIAGSTLGIIGMGRIGQAFAALAQRAFAMPTVYYNRRALPHLDLPHARAVSTIDEVLRDADVVSLHLSAAAGPCVIDSRRLALMKPTAILLNTARGSLIDEAALIRALNDGTVAGAGLDVFADEPHVNPALSRMSNVVMLPHLGSATLATREAMGARAIANAVAHLNGDRPGDLVE